jgi:hypothetical protein
MHLSVVVEDCYARVLLEPCLNEYYSRNDADHKTLERTIRKRNSRRNLVRPQPRSSKDLEMPATHDVTKLMIH